jgi:hypothetical protein
VTTECEISHNMQNTVCPTRYRTRHCFKNCSLSQQLGAVQTRTTDTFLFISHTTNVLLFKFRCKIVIGVRIIKEMPGSVASGTSYIKYKNTLKYFTYSMLFVHKIHYSQSADNKINHFKIRN